MHNIKSFKNGSSKTDNDNAIHHKNGGPPTQMVDIVVWGYFQLAKLELNKVDRTYIYYNIESVKKINLEIRKKKQDH